MAKYKSRKSAGQRPKMIYDMSKGEHVPNTAYEFDSYDWWMRKLGFGGRGGATRGEGALARRRKEALDKRIEEGGG